MKEWQEFGVDTANRGGERCKPLEQVFHVAHLETAHRILVDGRIRAGLVFDESRLNTERVLVSWLSPNFWHEGFRYGNVRFSFDFLQMIDSRRFYWVEVMRQYHPVACRILITDNEYPALEEYHPEDGDGPWWHDRGTGTHWWNGEYCLELMAEKDLQLLPECAGVSFVTHHPDMCSMGGCGDRGLTKYHAAARFVARVLGEGLDTKRLMLTEAAVNGNVPTDELSDAFDNIVRWACNGLAFNGSVRPTDGISDLLARALLLFYGLGGHRDLVRRIAGLYGSCNDLTDALADAFCEGFKIGDKQPFLQEPDERQTIK